MCVMCDYYDFIREFEAMRINVQCSIDAHNNKKVEKERTIFNSLYHDKQHTQRTNIDFEAFCGKL